MRILSSICNTATTFLKISQNSQENTHARVLSSLIFIKNTSTQVFPCYFWKLSSNTLFHNTSGRLTLPIFSQYTEFADLTKCRILGSLSYRKPVASEILLQRIWFRNHITRKKYFIFCLVFFM